MRKSCHDLQISEKPKSHYGNLERMVREIRDRRPLDLNAELWREAHSQGSFSQWQQLARHCLLEGLHYDPGPLNLASEVLRREEREGFILEQVAFNTTPWIRVNGYFLLPKDAAPPVPGIVMLHPWGGPMLFGKDRMVNTGRDHPVLAEYRRRIFSDRYPAEEFAKRGYAVIVIDAHHFGERVPSGFDELPRGVDPYQLIIREYVELDQEIRQKLYLGVRQLNWAGTTWMGLNYWDDSRCVDYLCSRPEVDPERIGCTGLSGGGWRTNFLAALDPRIKAAVTVGWMTTGDYQQIYNVDGVVGTFCLLPGVWDRLDVPDLIVMSAPCASMVVSATRDALFPLAGQQEAARQIALGYAWAGCPDRFNSHTPDKPHCFDADIQGDTLAWFDRHLKVS